MGTKASWTLTVPNRDIRIRLAPTFPKAAPCFGLFVCDKNIDRGPPVLVVHFFQSSLSERLQGITIC